MDINVENLGKRFNREQIFKDLNFHFEAGKSYAITGSNGSGKSTLLQVLSSSTLPSAGTIRYQQDNQDVEASDVYQHIAVAAPYLQLVEELTLREHLEFHFKFKKIRNSLTIPDVMALGYFHGSEDKFIKNFSSGMKQRLKLLLAFSAETPLLLLDEPSSNLDAKGIAWFQNMLQQQLEERLIILASNQKFEYELCEDVLSIENYK